MFRFAHIELLWLLTIIPVIILAHILYTKHKRGQLAAFGDPSLLEELMQMDWLCDNVEGTIPAYESLLPRSRKLVRLLGIYRESIPPEIEEAAK